MFIKRGNIRMKCWASAGPMLVTAGDVCRQSEWPSGGVDVVYIIKSHLGRDVY